MAASASRNGQRAMIGRPQRWASGLLVLLASCSSARPPGPDTDAGCRDAGCRSDSGQPQDAAQPDADRPRDAQLDADTDGGSDAGAQDSGTDDGGLDGALPRSCAVDNGGCEEVCVEADAAVSCACSQERELDPDGRRCHGWREVHDFEPIYYVADDLKVVLDPSGTALVVWVVDTRHVHFARYDGVEWGEPARLPAELEGSVYDLRAALSANGDAFIAWNRRPAQGAGGPMYTDVVRIDPAGEVHDHLELPQTATHIVADGLGNALLNGVYRHEAGQEGWSEQLTPGPVGPELALDAAGNGLSVDREANAIRANRYDVGVGWSEPGEIAPAADGEPRLGLYGSGRALAVWPDAGGFWASHYSPDEGWSDAVYGEGGNPVSYYPYSLAVDSAGNADLLWGEETGSVVSFELWTRHYDASAGWEAPVRLLDSVGTPSEFTLAVDESGQAVFVFTDSGLRARRRTESGWQAPTQIVRTSRIIESRAVSASNLGRGLLVAWIELVYKQQGPVDSEDRTVHVRRYD